MGSIQAVCYLAILRSVLTDALTHRMLRQRPSAATARGFPPPVEGHRVAPLRGAWQQSAQTFGEPKPEHRDLGFYIPIA